MPYQRNLKDFTEQGLHICTIGVVVWLAAWASMSFVAFLADDYDQVEPDPNSHRIEENLLFIIPMLLLCLFIVLWIYEVYARRL